MEKLTKKKKGSIYFYTNETIPPHKTIPIFSGDSQGRNDLEDFGKFEIQSHNYDQFQTNTLGKDM